MVLNTVDTVYYFSEEILKCIEAFMIIQRIRSFKSNMAAISVHFVSLFIYLLNYLIIYSFYKQ